MSIVAEFLPICPPPWDTPSDVIPMLVVAAAFLLGGWVLKRWSRKRKTRRTGKQ